jgi:hypothetical protein
MTLTRPVRGIGTAMDATHVYGGALTPKQSSGAAGRQPLSGEGSAA